MPEVSGSQVSEKQQENAANCRMVTLSKTEGENPGIRVVPKEDYTHMGRAGDDLCTEVVMEVVELRPGGALSKHNQLQPDAAIQKGDVVLSVNGVHGDYDAMCAQFAKDSVVFEVERREAQVHALEAFEVNETPGCFFCTVVVTASNRFAFVRCCVRDCLGIWVMEARSEKGSGYGSSEIAFAFDVKKDVLCAY